jgi:hypothetical protein
MEDAVKKTLVLTFSLIVVIIGSVVGASALPAPAMKANIPFAFYAGDQMLPAGEYLFEMPNVNHHGATGSILVVRTPDGSIRHTLLAIAAGSYGNRASQATFNKYGGTYFLSKVRSSEFESDLPQTRAEKELKAAYPKEAAGQHFKGVIVASSN